MSIPRVPIAAALAVAAALSAAPAHAAASFDFDGDGRQDLVAGAPSYQDAGRRLAGRVLVLPGTRRGVSLAERLIAQSGLPGPDGPETGDTFGGAVAGGDFDGDGHTDLAIGVQGENLGLDEASQGAVRIVYGSASGLNPASSQLIPGPGRPATQYSNFGAALVSGDFDRDGRDDLAVGANWQDQAIPETTEGGAGAIHLLFGGDGGITTARTRVIPRPSPTDRDFGLRLAVADINRDGHLDLVEGAQGHPYDTDDDGTPGHAYLFLGSTSGPAATAETFGGAPWTTTATREGLPGPTSIAIGDVTGDRFPDVVFGVPFEAYEQDDRPLPHGAVLVWRGTATGVAGTPIVIEQGTAGVPGSDEGRDRFGEAVAVGRLDGDRYADIVVGAPGENRSAGRVTIIRGAASGHAARGNLAFDRGTRGVPGRARGEGLFGAALTLLDTTGDRRPELVVGAPARGGRDAILAFRHPGRGLWSAAGARSITFAALGLPANPTEPYGPALGAVLGRVGSSR